jgi:WASH complex subunit strumpellin
LIEGVINEEYVLDKVQPLMNVLRDSNITVRWLMLHRETIHLKAKEIIDASTNSKAILQLMLHCSKYEQKLKTTFENLMDTKQKRWDEDKEKSIERMTELSEYYSGQKSIGKIQADDSFKIWFQQMKQQIESLTFQDSTYAGRKIQQLIKALEDIEQYQQISQNIQVKTYLHESRFDLKHMVRLVHVKKSVLGHIALISDITYSWQVLKKYLNLMQTKIKSDPYSALLLKSTFMKFSSYLNTPMVRIIQANSND